MCPSFYWARFEEANNYSKTVKNDTLYIETNKPLELLTISSNYEKTVTNYNNTYFLNQGDTIVLYTDKEGLTAAKSWNQNTQRDNELSFFPEMQKILGAYKGFGVYEVSFKKKTNERIIDIKELYNKRIEFLENYEYQISPAFKTFLKKRFYYDQYNDLFSNVFSFRTNTLNIENFDKAVWDFINNLEVDIPFLLNSGDAYFLYYIEYAKYLKKNGRLNELEIYENIKSNNLNYSELANFYLIRFLVLKGDSKVSKIIEDYLESTTDYFLKNLVKEKYYLFSKGILRSHTNADLQKSLFLDYNSKEEITWAKILEKNRGKVLYIDVWASWCGPCLEEMPFSETLKSKFKNNNDIEFIYISEDDNRKSWEKIINSKGFQWNNNYVLFGGSKSYWLKFFKIDRIPRYLLINKKGEVENVDTYRPSDPRIYEVLEKLLKE